MHSLEIIVYYLTKYSPHSLKKKKTTKQNTVCNAYPHGFGCRLNLSKYHHFVSMLW